MLLLKFVSSGIPVLAAVVVVASSSVQSYIPSGVLPLAHLIDLAP